MAAKKKTTKTVSDETLERLRSRIQNKLITKALEVECAHAVEDEVRKTVRSKEFRQAVEAEVRPEVFNVMKKNKKKIVAEIEKMFERMIKGMDICF